MNNKRLVRTKKEVVLEVWQQLSGDSVGARELELIQKSINDEFGPGAVDSPASIARILADEGAVLRHPEVLDFDSAWRQQFELGLYQEMSFASFVEARTAIQQLEELRRKYELEGFNSELRRLIEFVGEVRDDLRLVAKSETMTKRSRAEAREMAEWLSIWQSTPDLFSDWLQLRLTSRDFLELFPDVMKSEP